MSIFGGNSAGQQGALLQQMFAQMGLQQGLGALGSGYDKARADLTSNNYYAPYSEAGQGGLSMLQNALGLNGQSGKDAALSAFQNSNPGYQFAMDQGLQALDRSAASRGMLGSGNQQEALMQYGQGLANQNFGDWISRIGGLSQMGMSAAQGETGRQNTLANLDYGYGQNQAGMYQQANNQAGSAWANGLIQDQGANNQGQANLFSGILGGLKLGGQAYGGLGGWSGIKGLFS
ncbi:MAG: hypothetical protein JSS66_18970 [Armatimonadetes bacterium]|nr:hypothetical protein [Armatimonadota bacterium]